MKLKIRRKNALVTQWRIWGTGPWEPANARDPKILLSGFFNSPFPRYFDPGPILHLEFWTRYCKVPLAIVTCLLLRVQQSFFFIGNSMLGVCVGLLVDTNYKGLFNLK